MSRRNRKRRSAAELLDLSRSILFPDEDAPPTPIQIGQLDRDSSRNPDQDTDRNPDHQDINSNPDQDSDNPDHTDSENDPEQDIEDHPDLADDIPDDTRPPIQMEQLDQLAALTQALQLAGRPSFKPPSFSGDSDVGLFLKQFEDVADANRWTPLERTLHIRSQLQGDAQSCGQGESYQEIVDDLQARYGLTRRGARDRLSSIRLKTGQNVHKQASEISRLVATAFPMLPDEDRQTMALEYFSRAWESKAVQEHLLSRGPTTVREAVRATEEFLAIHEAGPRPRANAVEQTEEPTPAKEMAEAGFLMMAEAMKTQTNLLQQLILQLGSLQMPTAQSSPPAPVTKAPLQCYSCGGPHLKKYCPSKQRTQTGNGSDPARA